MAERDKLPRSEMQRRTRFKPDETRRELWEERDYLPTTTLAPRDDIPADIDRMNLKHRRRDILSDGSDRLHACCFLS